MRTLFPILWVLWIASTLQLSGQGRADVMLKGRFESTPFAEFAEAVEAQTGVRIHYRPHWVADVEVNAAGDSLSLRTVLQSALGPAGLYFHLEPGGVAYLSPQGPYVSALPDYGGRPVRASQESDPGELSPDPPSNATSKAGRQP
ncbi:MAG: hypothetical protein R2751_11515 [Bacteroidales bacterium]